MSQSDELDKLVEQLDAKGRQSKNPVEESKWISDLIRKHNLTPISVETHPSLEEWSMLNRHIGYLEGVIEMLVDSDCDSWVRAAREHYRTVYLGMPVVIHPDAVNGGASLKPQ